MGTFVGVGSSRQSRSFQAGQEAAAKALESMGRPRPSLTLVFASARFDQEALLKGIGSVIKEAPVVGCSTAGEIHPDGPGFRSVVVMAIRSDSLQAAAGLGEGIRRNPRQAGRDLAAAVSQARLDNPHGLLMFPDGITGNVAEVIRGVQDVLGLSFPIVGGCAADDFRFKSCAQYYNGEVHTDAALGVLLAGSISMGVGARHGWQPLGKPKTVTRALANVVQEVDGQPAARLYEAYFGKKPDTLKTEELARISTMYPLGFPVPEEEEYLLRNAIQVNADGGLVFSGEVPEGTEVRLMMGSKEKALLAARWAAEQAVLGIAPRAPLFGLVFSCVSRAQLFGRSLREELAVIRKTLGPAVPLVGFYDYGEQAPMRAAGFRGRSYLHNESAVVIAVSADR